MIAVSDAVLILVSAAVLGSGIYRWQNNVEQANLANSRPAATNPAGGQNNIAASIAAQSTETNSQTPTTNNSIVNTTVSTGTQVISATGTSGNVPADGSTATIERTQENVVVADPAPTSTINVADDNATTANNNAIADVPPYGSYIVKSGDSLSLIAEQYGTTVSILQNVNGIAGSLITVGQELRYPLPVN